jgi:type I restriction enzyme R subunit
MSRNEMQTCRELIEPALRDAGWSWDGQFLIGPGQVNITGGTMYDESQRLVVDYLLRLWQMLLAVLEAKAENEDAADGMQQASRYAKRLGLRFSIATNGQIYILTDNSTGDYVQLHTPPTPGDILHRLGRNIDWEHWRPTFEVPWHIDQVTPKSVRPFQQMAIFEALCQFGQGEQRVLLLMATGTGKTFVLDPQVFFGCNSSSIDFSGVACHRGYS